MTSWKDLSYTVCALDFTTSTLASCYSKDDAGTDLDLCTFSLFDSIGAAITDQPTADTDATQTQIDFSPAFTYYIAGGIYRHGIQPTQDIRVWVVGVPDTSAELGGSFYLLQGGLNLKHIHEAATLNINSNRLLKLEYNASTPNDNKIRIIFNHSAGYKHSAMFEFYLFK